MTSASSATSEPGTSAATKAGTPSPSSSATSAALQRTFVRRTLLRPEMASVLGAVIVFALLMAVAPSFRSLSAISTVLYASSTIGIMALAVGLLMIGGEFDLSAGVAVTFGALAATMMNYNWHLNSWTGALLSLLLAVGVGVFNGVLVMKTGIPSFLITLSSFLMLQGINLAVTKLVTNQVSTPSIADMQGFPSAQAVFASSFNVGGVSVRITVVWWLLFVAIATYVLYKTKVGNWIFAVGGDHAAARAQGVPVIQVKVMLFVGVSVAAWFVGMHTLFAFDSVQAGQGVGNEFLYIIAAVIGGISMDGGKGTAIGTAIGALIFGMINQGIVYAGWNPDWFKFFLGAMLLLAVMANRSVESWGSKARATNRRQTAAPADNEDEGSRA